MKKVEEHVIIYSIWVNGRLFEDTNQHFPIFPKDKKIIVNDWHDNFKKACSDYHKIKIADDYIADGAVSYNTEIFLDYHVCLYSIDVDVKEFEEMFDIKFDLKNDNVHEAIPHYVNYNFNVVAERIADFN